MLFENRKYALHFNQICYTNGVLVRLSLLRRAFSFEEGLVGNALPHFL